MGCGSSTDSSPVVATEDDKKWHVNQSHVSLAVLLREAKGLRDADGGGDGNVSDAYCAMRIGPLGTAFEDKDASTERRSATDIGNLNPTFNFGARFFGLASADDPTVELHVLVMDHDVLTADDSLGEVRVGLNALAAHQNEPREYALTGGLRRQLHRG
jgi:hypothetical protein